MPRFPWIIWRSTALEVLRSLVLATVALVGLIAFVGAVRPLADGRIGLDDALRLTALLSIPMLQFALPFAAGFAATIGFHRAASENETTAAHAAGISHATYLFPAVAIGVALSATLWVLANHTIPQYLERAERIVQRDLARILLTPLERGETVAFSNMFIHADRAIGPVPLPKDSTATAHITLVGVLAVENSDTDPVSYATADRADLWLFDDPDDPTSTVIQIVSTGASYTTEDGVMSHQSLMTRPVRLPRTVADDPKFLSLSDLLRLRREPLRSPSIARRVRALAARVAESAMLDTVAHDLATNKSADLTLPEGVITISNARLVPDTSGALLIPISDGSPVTITSRLTTRATPQTAWVTGARLRPAPATSTAASPTAPTLTLELRGITTLDPEGRVNTPIDDASYSFLSPSGFDAAPLLALPAPDVIDRAAQAPTLTKDAKDLRARIERLVREIDSKINERAAFAVACLIMVVLGSVMALRLKDAMLLPVYVWSFLPALAAVISISAGQGIAHDRGLIGFIILWGGVATLALVAAFQYSALRKH